MMVGVLSLEFLVHAWDYAAAVGGEMAAPDSLSDHVLGLAHKIITPKGRSNVGFDDPIDVLADASAFGPVARLYRSPAQRLGSPAS